MSIWRTRTTALLVAGVVILILAATVAFVISNLPSSTVEVRLGSGLYHARVADNEAERAHGLAGVRALNPDDALLMVFQEDGKWGIWMKDMHVAIDIVWLDSAKKVVYVVKNATPDLSSDTTFSPNNPARYILELPAGSVQASGLKTGQTAIFTLGESQ